MTNIPIALRADFRRPAPSDVTKVQSDLAVFGTAHRDGVTGKHIPLDQIRSFENTPVSAWFDEADDIPHSFLERFAR